MREVREGAGMREGGTKALVAQGNARGLDAVWPQGDPETLVKYSQAWTVQGKDSTLADILPESFSIDLKAERYLREDQLDY